MIVLLSAAAVLLALGACLTARWLHQRRIAARLDRLDASIRLHAANERLPAELVRAVIRIESGGDAQALSKRGACGLMQIQPDTKQYVLDKRKSRKVPDGDLFDPDYNIYIGTMYLRILLDRFDGDVALSLAAYNWGPANVAKLRRAHPELSTTDLIETYAPAATRAYCRAILDAPGVPASLPTTRP